MCYDISFTTSIELISDYLPDIALEAQLEFDFDASLHVIAQAHRKYPVIIREDGKYAVRQFEWGVIADYMDNPEKIKKGRSSMCNARSEKIVGDRKSYWHRIRSKRCLIPVTGIYEHREIKNWKNKVPYYVRIKERPLFCIPGLYHYAPVPDLETGEVRGTFTLITRAANPVMQQIHNGGENAFRMPLFLPNREMELQWLKEGLTDEELSQILDVELPSEALEFWPVFSIRSTKPRPDTLYKNQPFSWPNLPPLGTDAEPPKENLLFSI